MAFYQNVLKVAEPTIEKNRREQDAMDRARANFTGQASSAGQFAGLGEQGYQQTGREMGTVKDQLGRLMRGQDSYSAEQLRQGLGQQLAAQQSMAASARPGNSAMAARQAMLGMGRAASGMAGQQALAGIAERQAATQALGQLLGQQRGQDLQAALGARGLAMQGYGDIWKTLMGEPTTGDRVMGVLGAAIPAAGMVLGKPG